MKFDGEIKISWKAGSGEINTVAKGCEADIIDALAKSTDGILSNTSLGGLRGKALLNTYIAFLIDLRDNHHPDESSCIKIPMSAFPGGAK